MKLLFWISFALTAYAYFGYAFWLMAYASFKQKPIKKWPATTPVSVIIAVRNEEANLLAKLADLRLSHYPQSLLEIVIASDGSTDETPDILRAHAHEVVPVILDRPGGKAAALNAAVRQATSPILVFLDARQRVDPRAISELVSCFADPSIGAVSGELLLEDATGAVSGNALGIYWKIEKMVRKLESATGSVVGVTGAIYAIRRELFREIPPGTILDDLFVPMQVARAGKRVVFDPAATASDRIFSEKGKEFSRKVRTLTGNYQLLKLAPWMLSFRNPLLFRFISHKLLRLFVPLLLLLMLVASAFLPGPFFRAIFWVQCLFYSFALAGDLLPAFQRFKPVAIAHTFVLLNVAAAVAFYNFLAGKNRVWVR